MDSVVIVGDVVRAFLSLLVVLEIDGITARRGKFFVVGSDDTSGKKWVGSSFERVSLSFGGIERGRFAFSSIGGWDPEFSYNHSTDGQSTGLVGADILDTSQGFDSIHSSYQSVSIGEILRSPSECEGNDSDQRGGQNRNRGSDSVGGDSEGNIIRETGGSDNDDGDDDGTAE